MLLGHQTWMFNSKPVISATAAVVGPFEGEGPLADDFDIIHGDTWIGQDSWEKAEKRILEDACERAIKKAGLEKDQVQFFLGGDLMSQIISSSFTARTLAIPYLGIFGACSTSMEGLALASLIVDSENAETVICGTSSHNSSAEKQFRYPTEYGGQKPPTAQWTVTGAGAAVVQNQSKAKVQASIVVTSATIGRIIDMGISDPFNMGAAMAPAAVDTLMAHFRDTSLGFEDYDLVVTGDLGRVGHEIAYDLLMKQGITIPANRYQDCGILIYGDDKPETLAGGSGCACSATTVYGHLLKQMKLGKYKRILVAATGALLSPISFQQNETIPCICHAVSIEFKQA